MLTESPTLLWASTTIERTPPIIGLLLVNSCGWVTRVSAPTAPLSCKNIILTAGSGEHDMSVNITVLKKFSNSPSDWHVSWVQFGSRVQFVSQTGFTLAAIWSRSQACEFDTATEHFYLWQHIIMIMLADYRKFCIPILMHVASLATCMSMGIIKPSNNIKLIKVTITPIAISLPGN